MMVLRGALVLKEHRAADGLLAAQNRGSSLARFFKQRDREVAVLYHVRCNFQVFHLLAAGQVVHQVEHQLFQNHAQPARSNLPAQRFLRDSADGVFCKVQTNAFVFKEFLVLLQNGISWLGKNLNQCRFIQLVQDSNHRQAAHKLRNQPKLDQVLWLSLTQQLSIASGADAATVRLLCLRQRFEAKRLFPDAAAHHALQSYKSASADKQNVRCIYRGKFLVWMLASTLRGHICYRAFENLQQRLLHPLARNIARNRRVLVLTADLVYLINVDDPCLGASHIAVRRLKQLQNNVFNVLTNIPRLSQSGCVHYGERHIEHLGQSVRQKRFAASGRANQQNIGLRQLNIIAPHPVHLNALVVVIDRNRELLFCLVLPNHILIQERAYLGRLRQMWRSCALLRLAAVVFQNGIADGNALIADVRARVITG